MRWIAIPFLASLLVSWPAGADQISGEDPAKGMDELQWQSNFSRKIHQLFLEKNFAELDRIAENCWKGARTPSGIWQLDIFYDGIYLGGNKNRDSYWETYLGRFREWREQQPHSVTALIGLAQAWIEYAWQARGTGWASSVTETGWQLFHERLERSQRIMVENAKECMASPRWYSQMLLLARAQEAGRSKAWDLLRASARAFPDYFESYFKMAAFCQPRWGGLPGEWENMASWAEKNAGGDRGKEIYTRICWVMWSWEKDEAFLSPQAKVNWDKMKAGFEVMEKEYPDSAWNRTAFCYFAWLFRDRPVVLALLPGLERRLAFEFWRDRTSLAKTQAWAEKP